MPPYVNKKKSLSPVIGIMVLSAVLLVIISFQYWWAGVIGALLLGVFIILFFKSQKDRIKEIEGYISTLSHRVKKVGEEALQEMPIGVMLINDDYFIEWSNSFIASRLNEDTLVGRSLYEIAEPLIPALQQEKEIEIISLNERTYRVFYKNEERLLYLFDVTEEIETMKRYQDERQVIATILLDNYDDATQGMNDQTKSELNSTVTALLNKWALKHGIFLKRISSDRFIILFNERTLHELEQDKFSILDDVRETTAKQYVPITLSIGVGLGVSDFPELGALSQSSLDLALGRGGDQVAMKLPNGKLKFFGGKTNPMEKRTRVRARVISHALKDLIVGSDKVIVMGHKFPDLDAIGSAIGIRKAAEMNNIEGYIVIDFNEIDMSVKRLVDELKSEPDLYSRLISPEDALEIATEDTLLVVVDTHKPSLVIEEKLLNKTDRVVVIDHHRRSEDFINKPLLVYMEPYASSTAELVTELLEYQPKGKKLHMLEATALLSGIIVDTKSFTLRTGSRTFDAASYLRARGADTILVQGFMKEDIGSYVKRAKLIETMEFYGNGVTIATGDENVIYSPVMIAQAADTLLTMDGVAASFVISKRSEDVVGISARSLGDVNVQVIMEMLGGGGHLTNAAAQLPDITVVEAELQLRQVLDEYFEGGQTS
ncbi:DHH family phosphoesterase [Siminovitchia acidinfaciens]|uniref:Cyclic-di-AMP phosphodiesterase n=1 Tax=Siminovitchia acidinfaciens TaxID=2321395 RepID=A0A429XTF0_9BACI|nr:DHH family phosphoesterase [Siminovitchia acidinfaciens]RST70983.1 DHH family phosphoesterase [Siminovitchia acidinfaciens]